MRRFKQKGQSLVELMVALSIGALIVAGAAATLSVGLRSRTTNVGTQTAVFLGQEMLETVRGYAKGNWATVSGLTRLQEYYFPTTAAAGPIRRWALDEGAGTAAADSIGGVTGTLTNAPIWTPGKNGSSVSFDGSDDHIRLSAGSLNNLQTGSIALWAKWSGSQDGGYSGSGVHGCVVGRQRDGVGSSQIIGLNAAGPSGGKVRFNLYSYNDGALVGLTSVGNNVWRHIVVTYTSGSQVLYLDGVQDATGTRTGTISNDPLYVESLGAWIGQGACYSTAVIDDVRLYNRVLTPSEVSALYGQQGGPDQSSAMVAGKETVTVDGASYERSFVLTDVLRSGSPDPSTLQITVNVVPVGVPKVSTTTLSSYITGVGGLGSWAFIQTDWSGGVLLDEVVTTPNTKFSSSNAIDFSSIPGAIKVQGF